MSGSWNAAAERGTSDAIEEHTAKGMAEIACTIGCYTSIATLLNVFDVAVPQGELIDEDQTVSRR